MSKQQIKKTMMSMLIKGLVHGLFLTDLCHSFIHLTPGFKRKPNELVPTERNELYRHQLPKNQRIKIRALPHVEADERLQSGDAPRKMGVSEINGLDTHGENVLSESEMVREYRETGGAATSKPSKAKLPGALTIAEFLNQPIVELIEALLVVFSTLTVAIDTLDNLSPSIGHIVGTAGDIVAYIFCIIFGLRWYASAEQGPKYFAKPFVLVDILVVVLPLFLQILNREHMLLPSLSWLTSQGGLITLRLLRILRLQRVLTSMESFANFQRALGVTNPTDVQPYKLQLARVVLSISTLLSVAAGLIYTTEHEVNPALPDYFTALYFGLTTITTVGFGDITPVTTGGKLVVCGSILAGVAVIPGQAAALLEAVLESDKQRAEKEKMEKETGATSTNTLKTTALTVRRDDVSLPQRGLIDAVTPCTSCGATMHWVHASFCWSCGGVL